MAGGIHPPTSVIASWPPSGQSSQIHSNGVLAVTAVFGPLAIFTIFTRLWARFMLQRQGKLDDWIMLAAVVPLLGLLIAIPLATQRYGFRCHVWNLSTTKLISQRKLVMAIEVSYVWATGFIKMSVLLFYRRLDLHFIHRLYVVIVWVGLASVLLSTLAFTLVIFLSCRPLSAFWYQVDPAWIKAGHTYNCYNEPAHLLVFSAIGTFHDIMATTLPVFLCWNLQLPFSRKVALNSIFVVGYVVCLVSGLRIYAIYRVFYASYDVPWETWYVLLWTILEVLIAAICANLPACRIFITHYTERHLRGFHPNIWQRRSERAIAPGLDDNKETTETSGREMCPLPDLYTMYQRGIELTELETFPSCSISRR
ncbi:hypothetical protein BDV24DRAFT_173952 [Aspergillus arachidicola]|uniref:Rhodopsin domain-containing protein n=1 Tax=Aspergillus arachidicola TaxID=656916 RepID=A0A5N6XPA0_9EURO|nr:hypothetical protein BDV24DRAFT_173952 [Aspergillus arachidicola]